MNGSPLIRIHHVSKAYGGVQALIDVSLDIAPGEIHALVGENGAGKSTLIKILSGSVEPDDGKVVEGDLRPSSDTPTHCVLYRAFEDIGGVVHTHSVFATAWAQARREIPALGTTHADYFYGRVPCTRLLTAKEVREDYETNTGRVIVERFKKLDPLQMRAVLVANHAPFVWGQTLDDAVHNAVALEYCARLASETLRLRPNSEPLPPALLDKHFLRKHGPSAYYGQTKGRILTLPP